MMIFWFSVFAVLYIYAFFPLMLKLIIFFTAPKKENVVGTN